MKETTKRRVRGALIALVCFLLGGLVTLGVVWKVVGQDGRTLLQALPVDPVRVCGGV